MKISIIGGGITGITTALALHKLGISCKVYERAPEFKFVGAGIHLSPNALDVFKWLNIDEAVINAGVKLKNAVITHENLRPLRKSKDGFISDGSQQFMVGIHRAKLHQVLVDHLPEGTLELGHEFTSLEQKQEEVLINFSHTSIKTDMVLGCDGIHSPIRHQLFPASVVRYSGYTCWRGVAHIQINDDFKEFSAEAWGWKKRFGFVNIGDDRVYWFAVISAPQHFNVHRKDLRVYLKEQFYAFNPFVKKMIDATNHTEIFRDDIEDVKPMECWHKNKVCLMGDAAHATTPNMGQGGAQGIEDAYYMSQCIKKYGDPQQIFVQFEKKRRKKVDQIVNNSWLMGKIVHSTIGQPLLKIMMAKAPEKQITKQLQYIFKIDEPFC